MLAAIPVCDPAKEMKCAEPLSRRGLNKAQKKTTKLRFPWYRDRPFDGMYPNQLRLISV